MSTPEKTADNILSAIQEPPLAGYVPYIDYDTELERCVLGVCLFMPRTFSRVYGVLTKDCFYTEEHKLVFNAMHEVWQYGEPVDLVTISRWLYNKNIVTLRKQNTGHFLAALTMEVCSDAHLHHWCLKLRELAARRLMIQLTSTRFNGTDVLDGADAIHTSLQQVLNVRHASDWQNASAAAVSLLQHIDEVLNNDVVGISTGFPTLDRLNGGFRPGQLVVIGARPSVGKSALMGGHGHRCGKAGL